MSGRAGETLSYTPDGKLLTTAGTSSLPANPNPSATAGTPPAPASGPAGSTGTRFYDAGGNLVGLTDGTGTTVMLGSITAHATPGGVKTAAKSYTFAGKTVAQRTAAGGVVKLAFILSDRVDTAQTIVQPSSGATPVTAQTRYTDPVGLARGPTQAAAGTGAYATASAGTNGVGSNAANPNGYGAVNGYIGGLADTVSTLTHLGARDLDPVLGVFTSPDPVLDTANPNNFSPYGYANSDPINGSDPSGLFQCEVPMVCTVPAAGEGAGAAAGGSVWATIGGFAAAGAGTAVGLWFLAQALSPGASAETKAWWHNYETCGGGGCYASGNAIDAGTGSLSFDRPSVWTSPGASDGGGEADYGFTPSYYAGGYSLKAPSTGTPAAYNFAAAEAARKTALAETAAIGNANNAQTAAAAGGGRGTGGPSTTTGFADPGDDDPSVRRAIRSLQSQIDTHIGKLNAYRATPDAFDNQGLLARAPSQEIRMRIIEGRIRHLETEINGFQNQITNLLKGKM
jgi:RHS repeat-associated protein